MPTNEIIALDVGRARSGLARASTAAKLAEPLFSVATAQLVEKLRQMVDQGVKTVVVGLPRNLEGEDTAQTKSVRDFVQSAQAKLPAVNFYFQDEALTSLKAKSQKLKAKSQQDEHALAAAIILQDFLDSPASDRVAA